MNTRQDLHCFTASVSVVLWVLSLGEALWLNHIGSRDYSEPTVVVLVAFVLSVIAMITSETFNH